MGLFLFYKLLNLIFNSDIYNEFSFKQILFALYFGLKMDISTCGYILIFPFLLTIFYNFQKKILKTYTVICVIVCSFLATIDMEIYRVWDMKIDHYLFSFLDKPREAWASVATSPIVILILIMLCGFTLFYFLFNWLFNKIHFLKYNLLYIPVFFIIGGLIFVMMRGGLGIAPMNTSAVFKSSNIPLNMAAVNPIWNLLDSYFKNDNTASAQFEILKEEELQLTLQKLITDDTTFHKILNIEKPNILLIVWESCTEKVLYKKQNGIEITPHINKLIDSSLYFANIYASGDRTEKGICAIISGFPSQALTSISKDLSRSKKLPFLSKELSKLGYRSSFYYGGDSEFANMKTYLNIGKFDTIVDLSDFDPNIQTSKWGVYDEALFNKFLKDANKLQKPFFTTLLTLSSHEPFVTPGHKVIPGSSEENLFFNSLNYTDKQLNTFVSKLKNEKLWDSTLLIIVADHGHRLPQANEKAENFKIPLLFSGGALNKEFICKKYNIGSQVDIAYTLMSQLGVEKNSFYYSKNLLSKDPKEWAFFAFNNGFGMIDKQNKILHYNNSKIPAFMNKTYKNGIAMQQKVCRDYYR